MSWREMSRDELGPDLAGESLIWAVRNGKATIAVHAYAFGQYRIQCWFDRGIGAYPDILSPVC